MIAQIDTELHRDMLGEHFVKRYYIVMFIFTYLLVDQAGV